MSDAAAILLALPSIGAGDLPSWAMFGLIGCGQIVTWILMSRDGNRRALAHGEEEASAATKQAEAVRVLADSNDRLAKTLDSLETWARNHDLNDVRFQEKTIAAQAQLVDAITRLTTMQENLGNQIVNVATDRAMQTRAQAIPANAASPRRR